MMPHCGNFLSQRRNVSIPVCIGIQNAPQAQNPGLARLTGGGERAIPSFAAPAHGKVSLGAKGVKRCKTRSRMECCGNIFPYSSFWPWRSGLD